ARDWGGLLKPRSRSCGRDEQRVSQRRESLATSGDMQPQSESTFIRPAAFDPDYGSGREQRSALRSERKSPAVWPPGTRCARLQVVLAGRRRLFRERWRAMEDASAIELGAPSKPP